jgi:serine/threonine-protein kinase SRPK3
MFIARRFLRVCRRRLSPTSISLRVLGVLRSSSTSRLAKPPRQFPSRGFEVIGPGQQVEEERLPCYRREDYYPMCIGDVIQDRYQVVAKLGYGTASTVWLARDLHHSTYWALKVHINTVTRSQELLVYQHLRQVKLEEHMGQKHVRTLTDSFTIKGTDGSHLVFVMEPLGMSLRNLQDLQKSRIFPPAVVKRAMDQTLLGLDYLHDAGVIHTGLWPNVFPVANRLMCCRSSFRQSLNRPHRQHYPFQD